MGFRNMWRAKEYFPSEAGVKEAFPHTKGNAQTFGTEVEDEGSKDPKLGGGNGADSEYREGIHYHQ